METQAQTVTAITAAVDETALAADSMSNTIAAIREDTETVASEIDNVGQGFDALDGRLGSLKHSARSEEHTSELQSLMRLSYAVFCLKKKNRQQQTEHQHTTPTSVGPILLYNKEKD